VGINAASINAVKTVSPGSIRVGSQAVFTVTVTNTGQINLTSIRVVDNLTANLTYVSASVAPSSVNPLTWNNLGPLAIGGTYQLNITVEGAAVGTYVNNVTVDGFPANGGIVTDNASATLTVTAAPSGSGHHGHDTKDYFYYPSGFVYFPEEPIPEEIPIVMPPVVIPPIVEEPVEEPVVVEQPVVQPVVTPTGMAVGVSVDPFWALILLFVLMDVLLVFLVLKRMKKKSSAPALS